MDGRSVTAMWWWNPDGRGRAARRGVVAACVALVASLLAAVLTLVVSPALAQEPLLYPDLVSDPPVQSGGPEVVTIGGEERLVIRFAGYVTNVGDGPLDISGNPQLSNPADPLSNTVYQRVKQGTEWVNITKPLVRYETADGHNHFHLMEITRYTLWNAAKTAQVAPGQKVGFCLYDIERLANRHPDPGPLTYTGTVVRWCESGNPGATSLRMGITEGWRDIYGAGLTLQWVDISDVSPGEYWLAAESDPYGRVVEKNEANNGLAFANQKTVVPGYVAQPVGPVLVNAGATTEITMATSTFGTPAGPREFTITKGPEHGSINLPTVSPVATNRLNYTPAPGFVGVDTIEFTVRQEGSPYPVNPPKASITIQVGAGTDPVVSISGAPSTLVTGTSAQLTALTANLTGGVTWSVNGVAGGSSTVGTISATGLYVAPAAVPAGGVVTIRATSVTHPTVFDEELVSIVPPSNQAPTITDPGNQQSTVGVPVSVGISAFDPEGAPLAFTAQNLPPGLSIGLTNGVIVGTPTTPGVYSTRIDVTDGTTTSTESFTWSVVQAPSEGENLALNQAATQSSTNAGANASRAVDGNTSNDVFDATYSQTTGMSQAWWEVDLGQAQQMERVVLWSGGCCVAPTDFYVMASEAPFGNRTISQLLNDPAVTAVFHEGSAPPSLEVPLSTTARYVRIQQTGNTYLALNEVQVMSGAGGSGPNQAPVIELPGSQTSVVGSHVTLAVLANDAEGDPLSWSATGLPVGLSIDPFSGLVSGIPTEAGVNAVTIQASDGRATDWVDFMWTVQEVVPPPPDGDPVNLSPGRPASQSSTGGTYGASLAVDGITDGDFWNGSLSHTSRDLEAWWQVDLGASHVLDRVVVWNRTDCCTWRLADFWVLVSDQPFGTGSVDALRAQAGVVSVFHAGELSGASTVIDLPAATSGRYVRVMLTDTEYLQLAEVQVFGWS